MEKLEYIDVRKITPHKDNPRKDLGDISELTESIRQNGILQNLTVVKRYGEITGEWNGHYTVIIGHRRLAAARAAGLTEVPCVVAEMTEREQVAAMLSENMQRSDLTVYEQAQGFQMMLDLGATVDQVAEETGFSQTTVRRRVKLLALDREKFKAAESRGATLADYMELDKINDPALKNKVLDLIGTANFNNGLKQALEEEKGKAKLDAWEAAAATFARKIEEPGFVDGVETPMFYYTSATRWSPDNYIIEVPTNGDTVSYYYIRSDNDVRIYRDPVAKQEQETEEDRERKARENELRRIGAGLEEINKRHFNLRRDFIADFAETKVRKHLPEVCDYASTVIFNAYNYSRGYFSRMDVELAVQLLGYDPGEDDDNDYYEAVIANERALRPERVLLVCAYAMADGENKKYYTRGWNDEKNCTEYLHNPNGALDDLYNFLVRVGYDMSDEEKAMRDGTHEVFREDRDDG